MVLWSLWSQKKVFTRYVIVENNNIYISDIIISIIYTTLITLGCEIRRERKSVRSFVFIGKTNERTKERTELSIHPFTYGKWMDGQNSTSSTRAQCVGYLLEGHVIIAVLYTYIINKDG